jgi:hypothetical protein
MLGILNFISHVMFFPYMSAASSSCLKLLYIMEKNTVLQDPPLGEVPE